MELKINHAHVISPEAVYAAAQQLTPYINALQLATAAASYDSPESSAYLPFDDELLARVTATAERMVTPALQHIFVVGIGGSNLGTQAIYQALVAHRPNHPQMHFLDTVSTTKLLESVALIQTLKSPEDFLIISISKSGSTTETIANTEILLAQVRDTFSTIEERVVVISDTESHFAVGARERGIEVLHLPSPIGGRYSVLTAVGLFPLLAAGFDITALRRGAADILPYCFNSDMHHNPAAQSAGVQALALAQGIHIHDTFVFEPELEALGKWYRQLLGESIGKKHDATGAEVRVGLTPTVSVGSTDLHSVGQLYLGGPRDKVTTFVYTTDRAGSPVVPANRTFPEAVPMVTGQSLAAIKHAIIGGTLAAYNNEELSFMLIEIPEISEYELGAFVQYKMIEMMFLGKLLNVNPFDQPNVESYKSVTKDLLMGQG